MRLCMIGCRGHNGYVFDGLTRMPRVRVVGVSPGTDEDACDGLTAWCARNGHEPGVFSDWRRMLEEARPDVVSIAGPFHLHGQMCLEAFGRDIHVFCEKPVALTLEELARLRAAHARHGVHFAAMMGSRYDEAFHTAWRAVQEGAIGRVRLIETRKSYRLGERPAFYRRRETYGGTIPWVGSHAIDWIRWFSGRPFRSVFAAHSRADNRGHGELEMTALCHFTLADEVLASASIDYLRPPPAPTHGDDRIRVAGTEGVIEVQGGKVCLINARAAGLQWPDCRCDRQIFCDFVEQIEGRAVALLGPADTFAVTEACLLARQSADEGRRIDFPEEAVS